MKTTEITAKSKLRAEKIAKEEKGFIVPVYSVIKTDDQNRVATITHDHLQDLYEAEWVQEETKEVFEYSLLVEEKISSGTFLFFLNGEQLDPGNFNLTLIEALNIIGENGWELVLEKNQVSYIVKRKKK